MAETFDFDPINNRQHSMWVEAGIQFRSNLLLAMDSMVELHAHSFDTLGDPIKLHTNVKM